MGKYESLNVLSQSKRNDFMSDDAISEVANMINTCGGNRSQRRKLARDLGKVENIMEHAQKHLDNSARKECETLLEIDMVHFCCVLALTLKNKYRWKEDDTHDQISSMIESVSKNIDKYANQGLTTKDLSKMVEDEIGIVILPSNDW